MSDSWYDELVREDTEAKQSLHAAVLLAKTRYNEQLRPFVGKSMERLSFVHGEIDRIADETAAEVGAYREDVFKKLMKVIEAEVEIPVSEPEHVDLDSESSGEGVPSGRFSDESPEAQATTDVRDHEPVLEEEILHPDHSKIIPLTEGAEKVGAGTGGVRRRCPSCGHAPLSANNQSKEDLVCPSCGWLGNVADTEKNSCVRCTQRTASEGSPVCEQCETELVALAADDRPPLDGQESSRFVTGDRIVLLVDEFRGQTGTIAEEDGSGGYRVEWDIASPELPDWVQSDAIAPAKGEKAEAKVGAGLAPEFDPSYQGPPQQQQPAGTGALQPLNPNQPYECVVCHFVGGYDAVVGHLNAANDSLHMQYKQNPQQAQSPATAPGTQQTALQYQTARTAQGPEDQADPHAEEPVEVPDPQQQVSPSGKFSSIIDAMANRAAARSFSSPNEEEINQIAEQYGASPEDVRAKLIVHATFGDFTALNGKVGEGVVPEGYRKVEISGLGGPIDSQEAIVPTNSAVRKTADDLGMEEANVYDSLKEAMGADLGSEYHTEVTGEHYFYLPEDLVGAGNAPPEVPQELPPAQPQMQDPAQQAMLAKDLRTQAERMARRAARLETLVEGKQAV